MGSRMSKADLQARNAYLEKQVANNDKYIRHVQAVLQTVPGNLADFAEHHPEQAFQIYQLRSGEMNVAATPEDVSTSLIEFVKWGLDTNKIIVSVQRAETFRGQRQD